MATVEQAEEGDGPVPVYKLSTKSQKPELSPVDTSVLIVFCLAVLGFGGYHLFQAFQDHLKSDVRNARTTELATAKLFIDQAIRPDLARKAKTLVDKTITLDMGRYGEVVVISKDITDGIETDKWQIDDPDKKMSRGYQHDLVVSMSRRLSDNILTGEEVSLFADDEDELIMDTGPAAKPVLGQSQLTIVAARTFWSIVKGFPESPSQFRAFQIEAQRQNIDFYDPVWKLIPGEVYEAQDQARIDWNDKRAISQIGVSRDGHRWAKYAFKTPEQVKAEQEELDRRREEGRLAVERINKQKWEAKARDLADMDSILKGNLTAETYQKLAWIVSQYAENERFQDRILIGTAHSTNKDELVDGYSINNEDFNILVNRWNGPEYNQLRIFLNLQGLAGDFGPLHSADTSVVNLDNPDLVSHMVAAITGRNFDGALYRTLEGRSYWIGWDEQNGVTAQAAVYGNGEMDYLIWQKIDPFEQI